MPIKRWLSPHWRRVALIACSLLLGAGGLTTDARSRTAAPLKFEIKVVDAATGKPKSKYFLGEPVSVVFTLTNQGSRARTVPLLRDTEIPYTLVSTFENEDPETVERSVGGTYGSYERDGTIYWTQSAPRMMTLAPGKSVSMKLGDLRGMYYHRLENGNHTLTATYYLGRLKSKVSFRVVIDEAKSIPLLEEMAAAPAPPNGDESDKQWASHYLREIRLPSISGVVTDSAGKPLQDVEISVAGENLQMDTRENGSYYLRQLTQGGTYTLTPALRRAGGFDAEFTFEPASRTITNLNSKLTDVNFIATRVRPSINVADDSEGATARASSTLDAPETQFKVESVIDSNKTGLWSQCCDVAWVDATPNVYPDWVEITFSGPKRVDWINVFTLQDHPQNSPDPTLDETFTKDGITDFDVQYWNGRAWKNVPGGAIRGNRNVWRKIAFPTITTNKIRVVVRKALTPYSKIMEIEAFHINEFPVVKLTGRSKGTTGSSFQFHTKASDHDSTIFEYIVDFGDGTPDYKAAYGYNPPMRELNLTHTHTYAKAGTYTVTLRVLDHDLEGSETTMTVTVTDPTKPPENNNK